ncbi:lysine-rich arabinogalactan protein 19-like isoform X1 [Cajanus cajan]|uniref:lysine-rich arabinogalactan protein 19-like isoform X1 n=1 Tax=Cajanus cajan TaxID=3821 RepID=UPI00098DB9B7|nr:lysine-rich arabinogalactan protein 19-like isoform X1 [Cajanus cajan]
MVFGKPSVSPPPSRISPPRRSLFLQSHTPAAPEMPPLDPPPLPPAPPPIHPLLPLPRLRQILRRSRLRQHRHPRLRLQGPNPPPPQHQPPHRHPLPQIQVMKVLVNSFGELEGNAFLEPRTAQVAIVDHVKQGISKLDMYYTHLVLVVMKVEQIKVGKSAVLGDK